MTPTVLETRLGQLLTFGNIFGSYHSFRTKSYGLVPSFRAPTLACAGQVPTGFAEKGSTKPREELLPARGLTKRVPLLVR
jgi:hypothetical protein